MSNPTSSRYREIESLREYVLIAQDRVSIEIYSRQSQGGWLLRDARSLAESITLESIIATISLSEILLFRRIRGWI